MNRDERYISCDTEIDYKFIRNGIESNLTPNSTPVKCNVRFWVKMA